MVTELNSNDSSFSREADRQLEGVPAEMIRTVLESVAIFCDAEEAFDHRLNAGTPVHSLLLALV